MNRFLIAGVCPALVVLLGCSSNPPPSGNGKDKTVAVLPDDKKSAVGGGEKDKSAEAPQEESVVPYDSKTHGALQVTTVDEKTVEWFNVLQNGERAVAGAPPKLNTTVELAPGAYVVSVNHTERKLTIEAGKKRILLAGELLVKGKGGMWSPWQGKERRLATVEPRLDDALSLFAGTYTVKVFVFGQDSKELGPVEVKAGQRTVVTAP